MPLSGLTVWQTNKRDSDHCSKLTASRLVQVQSLTLGIFWRLELSRAMPNAVRSLELFLFTDVCR